MSGNLSKHTPFDAISEGADARSRGQRRDACPYPAGSRERTDWLEGFAGVDADRPPDLPLDQTG